MQRLARMAAAVLGASLALWLLSGDRDPAASDGLLLTCTVDHHDTFDMRGTQFFGLACPHGSATLSIDNGLELARWLRAHDKQRITVDLAPRVPQKLER